VLTYRFFFVGKRARDPLVEAVELYLERLAHYARVDLHRFKDSNPRSEGAQMLGSLHVGDLLIALDEGGKPVSTAALAGRIARWQQESRTIGWAIGGAGGLSPELGERAEESWSLSAMTLPHRLAQVVLVEQLYRAHTVLRGEPYHRG